MIKYGACKHIKCAKRPATLQRTTHSCHRYDVLENCRGGCQPWTKLKTSIMQMAVRIVQKSSRRAYFVSVVGHTGVLMQIPGYDTVSRRRINMLRQNNHCSLVKKSAVSERYGLTSRLQVVCPKSHLSEMELCRFPNLTLNSNPNPNPMPIRFGHMTLRTSEVP